MISFMFCIVCAGSKHGKRVQANLGAKNHATVMMNDADRNSTIKALVGAAFGAAGQRCMALSVVILVGEVEEARGWVEEMAGEAKKLKVGNGFVDGVDVGELRVDVDWLRSCFHHVVELNHSFAPRM